MARIRSVKPELCTSETMAAVSAVAERTFVRLWTHCDDEGRCKDNPKLLKAALFPLHDDVTPADLDAHLWELSDRGLIVRYSVAGDPYLHVPSWREHQKPQKRQESKLPDPEGADEQAIQSESRTATRPLPETYGPVVEGRGRGVVVGDVEVVPAGSTLGQPPVVDPDADPDAAAEDREQAVRAAAVAVGRAVAAEAGKGPGYAVTVTKRILQDQDRTDRDRIRTLVDEGKTADEIAAAWATGYPDDDRPADNRPPLRAVDDPPPCPDCLGSGWVSDPGSSVARRCDCNPHPASRPTGEKNTG